MKPELLVTLWPSFPHFTDFADDERLAGIRLNSAMTSSVELESEIALIDKLQPTIPLYFDVKGRQLRITQCNENPVNLDLMLNHPIRVRTPTPVLFKAGAASLLLERTAEDGRRLIFRGGAKCKVLPGESLCIRDPSLSVGGAQFIPAELAKIEQVKKAGFRRYFLSYTQCQRDVDEFLELVGRDSEVWLKIEDPKGLRYVATEFKKRDNLTLVAARGDLYVELLRPHEILGAMRLIVEKDPDACVGSRMLLSVANEPVPSCADFHEMAWLKDIGYRRFMLCDELCLKGELLSTAVNVFDVFRGYYRTPVAPVAVPVEQEAAAVPVAAPPSRGRGWFQGWWNRQPSAQ